MKELLEFFLQCLNPSLFILDEWTFGLLPFS